MEHWNNDCDNPFEYEQMDSGTQEEIEGKKQEEKTNRMQDKYKDNDDDDNDDDYDDDDNRSKRTFRTKENMGAREYRDAISTMHNHKHLLRQFDKIWLYMFAMKDEYKNAMQILSTQTAIRIFTLYDIVCYKYLNENGEKIDTTQWTLRQQSDEASLRDKVMGISEEKAWTKYKEDNQYEKMSDDDKNALSDKFAELKNLIESDFKGFQCQAYRVLHRYFDVVLGKDGRKELFSSDNTQSFNIFDYGFFSYLLDRSSWKEINYMHKNKFDQVSPTFYYNTYKGLRLMAQYHDIGLNHEKIINIFVDRFHAGQALADLGGMERASWEKYIKLYEEEKKANNN